METFIDKALKDMSLKASPKVKSLSKKEIVSKLDKIKKMKESDSWKDKTMSEKLKVVTKQAILEEQLKKKNPAKAKHAKAKPKKKSKKSKLPVKVKIGTYVGRRGKYKIYKISPTKVIAIRSRKKIRGGIEEGDVENVEHDDNTYDLYDLGDMFKEKEDSPEVAEEVVKEESSVEEASTSDEDEKLLAEERGESQVSNEPVMVKPIKKRIQSESQRKWMDFVAKVSMLPEMKGKSRAFIMQEASRRRKLMKGICPEV